MLHRVAVLVLAAAVLGVSGAAQPAPGLAAESCPVTKGNGKGPPGFGGGRQWHGNGEIWSGSYGPWPDGIVKFAEADRQPYAQEMYADKWMWWERAKFPKPSVTGERIDGPAPPAFGDLDHGHETGGFRWFASGMYFPSEGCWRITATAGEAKLTFVVRVIVE
jgi:hypothetical protein